MLPCLFKDTRSTECHVTSHDTSPMLWSRTLLLHPLVWRWHQLLRGPSSSYFFMCIYTHAWCKSISVGLCSKDFSVSHPSILRSPESSCCKSTLTWTFDLWGWGVLSSVRLTEGRTPCQRGMKTANNTTSTVIALHNHFILKHSASKDYLCHYLHSWCHCFDIWLPSFTAFIAPQRKP